MNIKDNTTKYDLNNSRYSGNSLFTAGAVTIIIGLILPASGILVDILLAFSLFIGAAISMIAFSNIKPGDLKGFAGMAMIASIVRIFTSIILVRLVLTSADTGLITQKLSSPLLVSALLSTIAAITLMLILTGITIHRVRIISNLKMDFFGKILQARQAYIASVLRTNNIDSDNAKQFQRETNTISSFFARISTCSRFIFCENILAICALIFGITGVVAVSATGDFPPEMVLTKACQLVIAASLLTALSLLSTAAMSKISVCYFESSKIFDKEPEPQPVQRRKVTSAIAEPTIDCKPLTDVIPINTEHETVLSGKNTYAHIQDTDWYREDDLTKFMLWQKRDLEKSQTIHTIADIINGRSFDEEQIILIASDNIRYLPVTVPVNIAVELSNAGLKCLIVDLDLKRRAMSHVFDVVKPNYVPQRYIAESGVDGISLICADLIDDISPEKVVSIIELSTREYDRVLIYAPDIKLSGKVELISTCCKSAMLFGEQNDYNENMSQLRKNLIKHNCDIIEPDEVFVEV